MAVSDEDNVRRTPKDGLKIAVAVQWFINGNFMQNPLQSFGRRRPAQLGGSFNIEKIIVWPVAASGIVFEIYLGNLKNLPFCWGWPPPPTLAPHTHTSKATVIIWHFDIWNGEFSERKQENANDDPWIMESNWNGFSIWLAFRQSVSILMLEFDNFHKVLWHFNWSDVWYWHSFVSVTCNYMG